MSRTSPAGSMRVAVAASSAALSGLLVAAPAIGQTVTVDTTSAARHQTIDGFGTCLYEGEGQESWWQDLFYDDLRSSILRFDITPTFRSPYSDQLYNCPWYHDDPPLPGPDGNNVRAYTDAEDYTATWNGRNAQIAVMGPDIEQNIDYFDYDDSRPATAGAVAQAGMAQISELGDFKLVASMWSPAPWLKLSSGNTISGQSDPLPRDGAPWPFIWAGNFSGGLLDTSDTPLAIFDDSALGGTGPTSALTQFARALAAYLLGFQRRYGVDLYAVSIQNELNFEVFYNSCTYPLSEMYLAALKAARAELDQHTELQDIRIMGPEDLLGGDGWGLWQYGGGNDITHKNLQYLQNIAADPVADQALDFFCIHGYAPDGVSSAGADPVQWDWWVNGWSTAPADGLPATTEGFASYGKKSWMTETSGEDPAWLAGGAFPGGGGWSIALKIHQALTVGQQSAWIYWQLTDGSDVANETLTDATLREGSPKYVAAKHFFHYIRPGAERVTVSVAGSDALEASAYVHDTDATLTVVLINTSDTAVEAVVQVPSDPTGIQSFDVRTSSENSYWQASSATVSSDQVSVTVPGFGVATLWGQGDTTVVPGTGGAGGGGGASSDTGGAGGDGGAGAPGVGGTVAGAAGSSGAAGTAGGPTAGGGTAGQVGTGGEPTVPVGSGGADAGGGADAAGGADAGGDSGAVAGDGPSAGAPSAGGSSSTSGAGGAGDGTTGDDSGDDGGCGCRTPTRDPRERTGAWLLALLGVVCWRRRTRANAGRSGSRRSSRQGE